MAEFGWIPATRCQSGDIRGEISLPRSVDRLTGTLNFPLRNCIYEEDHGRGFTGPAKNLQV
jgi:hypothetical protein